MTLLELLSCLVLDNLMYCYQEIVLVYCILGFTGAAVSYPSVKFHY